MLNLYKKYQEKINYLIVGGLTTLVSLLSYYALTFTYLNPHIDFELQCANVISWIISVTFAYFMNRKYVFNSYNKNLCQEVSKFYISRLGTLLIDMLFMYLLVAKMGFNDKIIKIVIQVIVIVLNYVFSKIFVFQKKSLE